MVVVAADDCCVGDSILWKDKAWLRTNNLLTRYLSCGRVWWGQRHFFWMERKKSMRKQKVPTDVFQDFWRERPDEIGGTSRWNITVKYHGEISRWSSSGWSQTTWSRKNLSTLTSFPAHDTSVQCAGAHVLSAGIAVTMNVQWPLRKTQLNTHKMQWYNITILRSSS